MTIKDRTAGDEMTQEERWTTEHINVMGHLSVPVERSTDPSPVREGWEPIWVTIDLSKSPQKNVKYKRIEE